MTPYISTGQYKFFRAVTGANGSFIKSMVAEALTSNVIDVNLMVPDQDYTQLQDVNGVLLKDVNGVNLYALAPGGSIDESDFTRGDKVEFYRDITINQPYLTMYVDSIERVGEKSYILHCTSALGMLQDIQSLGGMYSGAKLGDVLAEVMQASMLITPGHLSYETYYSDLLADYYYVYKNVSNVYLTGHLPIASVRDNALAILFATGASLYAGTDGKISIRYDSPEYAQPLPDDQIYVNARVEYSQNVTDVTVREHTFIADNTLTPEVLYQTTGAIAADHEMIVFDKPYHTLVATADEGSTFVINQSNCNYAIVTGSGTLTGIPYIHTTTDFTQSTGKTGTKKEVAVTDMTLISQLNSANTLNRLVNYYANAEIVRLGFKLSWYGNERTQRDVCGYYYTFTHPYTKAEINGFLKEFEVNFSSFAKADAKFVTNWMPKYLGNTYNNYFEFTEDGTWTCPDDVTSLRLILVGGGKGGHGGYNGSAAPDARGGSQTGGVGGDGAEGGTSGKVYIVDVTVTPGQTYSITVGQGGAGGAAETEGAEGTASVFGTYSSASGTVNVDSVINPLTGDAFGGPGINGQRGADGGQYDGNLAIPGGDFTDALTGTVYKGGNGIKNDIGSDITPPSSVPGTPYSDGRVNRSGAAGGGAAYGVAGGAPYNSSGQPNWGFYADTWVVGGVTWYTRLTKVFTNWQGGKGADALPTVHTPRKGQGGCGGNGGGGGGQGSYAGYTGTYYSPTLEDAPQGIGGAGSVGGPGGNGIVIGLYN